MVVSARDFNAIGSGAGGEQRLDGFRGAAILPIGIHARLYCQRQGGSSSSIERVDGGAAFDEQFHDRRVHPPGGRVQGSAVRGEIPVTVALAKQRRRGHAEVEKAAHAFGVAGAGEFGQERSTIGEQFTNQRGLVSREFANGRVVGQGAGGDEPIDSFEVDGDAAPGEKAKDIPPAAAGGDGKGRSAGGVSERWIGAVVE
jgi:hypothetical protein